MERRIRFLVEKSDSAEVARVELLNFTRIISQSDRQCLVLGREQQGRSVSWSELVDGENRRISSGVVKHVFDTGEVFACDNARDVPWLKGSPTVDQAKLASIYCVPLRRSTDAEIFGVLYMDSQQPGKFTLEGRSLVQEYAARLAKYLPQSPVLPSPDNIGRDVAREIPPLLCSAGSPLEQVMARIRDLVDYKRFIPVLITGENGTGKEVVARQLYFMKFKRGISKNPEIPFIPFNCGTAEMIAGVAASEIFGHEPGAFTGATRRREGLLRTAKKGLLFLDEIGTLKADAQAAMLRALDSRRAKPLGADHEYDVEAWIVAATNENLEQKVARGDFREDLLNRLRQFTIEIPPLRDRPEADLRLLTQHFIASEANLIGIKPPELHRDIWKILLSHSWPGNVRELRFCLERAMVLSYKRGYILPCDIELTADTRSSLSSSVKPGAHPLRAGMNRNDLFAFPKALTLDDALQRIKRYHLLASLRRHRGNVKQAAEDVGQPESTFRRWLKELDIDIEMYQDPQGWKAKQALTK